MRKHFEILLTILFILALAFCVSAQTSSSIEDSTGIVSQALIIDGQPALRITAEYLITTEISYSTANGEDTLMFWGNFQKGEGRLFVSKSKLVFKPIRAQEAAFSLETAKVKNVEMDNMDMGRFKLVKFRSDSDKYVFQIRFAGEGEHRNGNTSYALPVNNFLIKCLTNFDAALAEFRRLTASAHPK